MSILKNTFLWLITLTAAYFSGFYLKHYSLVWLIVWLSLLAIFSFFAFLFEQKLYLKVVLSLASILAAVYPFWRMLNLKSILFLILVFLFFLWAIVRLKTYSDNSLKISVSGLFRAFSPSFFTALSLFLCLISYFSLAQQTFPLPYSWFEKTSAPILKTLPKFIGFVDKTASQNIEEQWNKKIGNIFPEGIPAWSQKSILNRRFGTLNKDTSASISASLPSSKDIYKFLSGQYQSLNQKTKNIIVIVILTTLFFTFKSIFYFLAWIVSFVVFILFYFLKACKFFRLQYEPRDKEVIKF